jgi:magnesium-transporting ATPase (P-type)
MNLINLKYSQSQTLIVGILASINLYYFSNVKPVKKISHIRAPHTIWNIWFGLSFFGQIVIFIFCNYYALNKIGLKYLPEADKKVSADTEFQKSFLNTVIFLFSAISQSTVFISNHGG